MAERKRRRATTRREGRFSFRLGPVALFVIFSAAWILLTLVLLWPINN